MTTVVSPGLAVSPTFPIVELAAVLRDELLSKVRSRYRRKGEPLPKSDDEVVVTTIDIDSLTVIEILSALDDFLPFQVNESVVKSGGYTSIANAVERVTARIKKKWDSHHDGERR